MTMKTFEVDHGRFVKLNCTEAAVAIIIHDYGPDFSAENAVKVFMKEGCTEADITPAKINRALESLHRKGLIDKRKSN